MLWLWLCWFFNKWNALFQRLHSQWILLGYRRIFSRQESKRLTLYQHYLDYEKPVLILAQPLVSHLSGGLWPFWVYTSQAYWLQHRVCHGFAFLSKLAYNIKFEYHFLKDKEKKDWISNAFQPELWALDYRLTLKIMIEIPTRRSTRLWIMYRNLLLHDILFLLHVWANAFSNEQISLLK